MIKSEGRIHLCVRLYRELMKDEIQEEKQEAVDAAIITNIKSLMQTLSMDAKAAMETLKISAADQLRYMAML